MRRVTDAAVRHSQRCAGIRCVIVAAFVLVAAAAAELVTRLRTAQTPDPHFDAHVDHPAASHQLILFDAAHRNFHKASGNYKPFADLLRSDGFTIEENREPFTAARLSRGRVLVIGNALGTKGVSAMLANIAHWLARVPDSPINSQAD